MRCSRPYAVTSTNAARPESSQVGRHESTNVVYRTVLPV
jgi:hypothetical protein